MGRPAKPTKKSAVAELLVNSKGPINFLRARGMGMDLVLKRPPILELYYEPGDPHSHLCMQMLALWRERLQVPVKVYIVPAPRAEAYPESDKQRGFALQDAIRIAPAWGLLFPEDAELADRDACAKAARILLACDDLDELLAVEAEVADALFTGKSAVLDRLLAESDVPDERSANLQLAANEDRRCRLGHYLPAMWQFNGEWFWALDRCNHLEARLRDRNALSGDAPLAEFDTRQARLPELDIGQQPLEFFFSFRSPYSYLAAVEVQERYQQWPCQLQVRPVLPMVMRGLPVPLEKRLYIVRDVKREADRLGIPFGRIADPVGAGAERCLNTFPLARDTRQQLDFLVQAGTYIFSRGIDVATDEGLAHVCEQAGIDWQAAKSRLDDGIDLGYAEKNRADMFASGLWGVPSFKLGDFATWGRDRIWMIEEILRRS